MNSLNGPIDEYIRRRRQESEQRELERLRVNKARHKCLRCNEEFDCPQPTKCAGNVEVEPHLLIKKENGFTDVMAHCPDNPTWEWIREYGARMRALGANQGLD